LQQNRFLGENQKLESIELFAEKIKVAQETKVSQDFLVIARIEAFIAGQGLEEVLKRAEAYEEAGANALLIHSKKKDASEIYEFCNFYNGDLPIVIVPTTYPDIDLNTLNRLGIRMVIYANHGIRSSVDAMKKTFSTILENGNTLEVENNISPMAEIFELQGTKNLRSSSAQKQNV
jgi:phosphoenolpyruvate phosphomutase